MPRHPFGILMLLLGLGAVSARAANDRTPFPNSIRAVAAAAGAAQPAGTLTRTTLSAAETAAPMAFEVGLRMRNFGELQARIARGETISDAEKALKYFPRAADHDRLVAWLQAQGLAVTRTDANHLGVFGRGTVAAVSRAFEATFARVADRTGREFTSAITAPSLPADLAPLVAGVHGLQPHLRRHPLSTPRPRVGTGTLISGYTPAQIATAYNATGLSGAPTGSGQTIAIYALGYPETSDLSSFWTNVGSTQTAANVALVDVAGGPGIVTDQSVLEEATLDTEWAGAIAPGAKIRLYGASETDPAENDEIYQQVYADLATVTSMHILSVSIGGNELDVPADYLVIESQYLANLASAGVTVLVASGDNGATVEGELQTSYPTSDPDVTGVGGTTLQLTATNTIQSEIAWSGSGGGISVVFARPSWQVGTGVPAGSMRLTPDVAAAADNHAGAYYYFQGAGYEIGGTSWAAPTWAGFVAMANQAQGTALGFLNPKLYPAAGAVSAYTNDITSGSNGAYTCNTGYDLVTGLGSPNVAKLVAGTFATSPATTFISATGNQAVTIGQSATFFVVGSGPSLTYQWQLQASGSTTWTPLANGGVYSGVTTPLLVVSHATDAMTGESFQCVISGSGAVTSPAATLTVNHVGVTTLAGWPGAPGHSDGTGWAAGLALPGAVRTDAQGNIYIGDTDNYTVRKVTPQGVVTTLAGLADQAGSADGPVATATFNAIGGVAPDDAGNVYVADSSNYTIRKISAAGQVSTLAGLAGTRGDVNGTGSVARLYDPQNLAWDPTTGNLFVADGMGNVVREVTPAGGVTTFAGSGAAGAADGPGTEAEFNDPTGIAVDAFGNVYVADYGNNTVRKITPAGLVSTLAGTAGQAGAAGGNGAAARFNGPAGVGVDSSGNVYVADATNNLIRKIAAAAFVTTVAGTGAAGNTDGLYSNATFDTPGDVAVDASGIIYVADSENSTLRRIIQGVDSVPSFTAQPASLSVAPGATATFAFGVTGTAPFTYQWSYNGAPVPGANAPFYTLANAQDANEGSYTVTVSNLDGAVTSSAATLTIATPAGDPDITAQPLSGSLASGADTLSVTVTGPGPFTYQWYLNGAALAGATGATYTATTAGSYTVKITNATGAVTSTAAVVGTVHRLVNLSTRAAVGTGAAIAIAGFSISGPAGSTKELLIRGVGPTLTNFSISDYLANPVLTLFTAAGAAVDANTGWTNNARYTAAEIAALASQVGAFTLNAGSADSVLVESLAPGNYTVQLAGAAAATGVGLAEVYETSTTSVATLTNISTRAQVGTGADIVIAGFVIEGSQPMTVLVRGVGPGLTAYGVTGVLAAPVLTVYDADNNVVGANTGWDSSADNAAAVSTLEAAVGAFALAAGSADSALVLTLAPGSYTAQVTGAHGGTGVALVEIYESP